MGVLNFMLPHWHRPSMMKSSYSRMRMGSEGLMDDLMLMFHRSPSQGSSIYAKQGGLTNSGACIRFSGAVASV